MKITSKNYDGKFYIKLCRKYIPLEQCVEIFENLEKENERLKQQIEKMKNCRNCEHYETVEDYGSCRAKCVKNKNGQWILTNWELYKD